MDMSAGMFDADRYSEFDVQLATVQNSADGGSSNAESETVHEIEPIAPTTLDNNEVAELVAHYRVIKARVNKGFQADIDGNGSLNVEYSMAVNTPNRDDHLPQLTGDDIGPADLVDQEGSTIVPDGVNSTTISDAETLDFDSFAMIGAGNGNGHSVRYINHRDEFGRGPVLDANDRIHVFLENDRQANDAQTRLQTFHAFYWDTATLEEVRTPLGV